MHCCPAASIGASVSCCAAAVVLHSVTINPPLYGADTPMSFFDEKLPYGWNLRDLGDLLKQPHIPQVGPGCQLLCKCFFFSTEF